jgi:hypothetical protein
MKNRFLRMGAVAFILVLLFVGCATTESGDGDTGGGEPSIPAEAPETPPEDDGSTVPEGEPEQSEPEQSESEESEPEESESEDPEPEVSRPEEPQPEEIKETEDEADEPIEVSEELYEQTFTEVEKTISELNEIIADRNFSAWQDYLTDDYRRTYSDPEVLAESSQSTVLVRNNITLRTLEDYFNFVVVPSRSNARLDDLVFIGEETVEAIMEVNERRYLLYLLKKTGNRWKIDTF